MSSLEKVILVDRVVVGDGATVLGPSSVILKGSRIVLVVPGHVCAPYGHELVDFGLNSTLLPGFIDCHVHLSIFSNDYQLDVFRVSSEERALRSFAAAQGLLRAGFTTLRSAGDADATGVASLDIGRLCREKALVGPRIVGAGHYISVTGGGGDICNFKG
jgi:imidazolonepropionase-like amidohydrolase